ncbi:hypothetical protein N8I77_001443 [Diaporthe amygdali]|uniref:Nudix hydrolase domain-containing protein n=1 Tax=Phomopsis amygdali TaxID=1214568 RepID=A0AAD9SS20_PHOAM|nr:hypothetical protein N8I77_001443 [Diaporthe amygdali]
MSNPSNSDVRTQKSLLQVLNDCDKSAALTPFPVPQADLKKYTDTINSYYHFIIPSVGVTLGYVVPSVAAAFRDQPGWVLDEDAAPRTLALVGGDDKESRSALVEETLLRLRSEGKFVILSRWRNEVKPVYGPRGQMLFAIERAAAPLLGVLTYGIQITAFTRPAKGEQPKIWVQKRSKDVKFYPGFLDNTVAGGMPIDEEPLVTATREASEEASLGLDIVKTNIKPCGTVSYMHLRDGLAVGEVGLIQPQVEFLFELELPADVEPSPSDGEVEWFKLYDVNQIRDELVKGNFKPSYSVVILDFLVRHGLLHAGNLPDFVEITTRLHRPFEFPIGHSGLERPKI